MVVWCYMEFLPYQVLIMLILLLEVLKLLEPPKIFTNQQKQKNTHISLETEDELFHTKPDRPILNSEFLLLQN